MKFKERLWQLFLAIVLGVTLSVCDAGLQDDEFDSNALVAGSAIAAGVTSGDGYVKIGEFMILSGEKYMANIQEDVIIEQSFGNNIVFFYFTCGEGNTHRKNAKVSNSLGTPASLSPETCRQGETFKYTILGKYK